MFLSGMLARGRTRVKTDRLASLSRLVRWLPTAVCVSGIFYLSQQSAPLGGAPNEGWAAGAHLLLYAALAALLLRAFASGTSAPTWALALVTFALAVLYGVSDEIHQAYVPGRTASEADIALDAAGAALGIGLTLLLTRLLSTGHDHPGASRNH